MATLVDALSKLNHATLSNQTFADIGFGTITSEAPLTMTIMSENGELNLKAPTFVHVAQHLTDYEIEYELNQNKTETELTHIAKTSGFYVQHEGKQAVEVSKGSLEGFVGKGTIKLLNHLEIGDLVIYARMHGGSKYIILDRIGEV